MLIVIIQKFFQVNSDEVVTAWNVSVFGFFWSVFSRMRENTDQKISEFGQCFYAVSDFIHNLLREGCRNCKNHIVKLRCLIKIGWVQARNQELFSAGEVY